VNYEVIDIRTVSSKGKGALSYLEIGKDILFDILRVYYIYGVPSGTKRGGHAHRKLKQLLFCPYGSVEIIMDDGCGRESVLLDRADKGLVVLPCIWREMKWISEDSVLCAAVSMYYDESDYIRDYDEFLRYIRDGEINGIC
jgi:dTDP-4-dehydrorhamnose 3,5-epimerase-like enzyme